MGQDSSRELEEFLRSLNVEFSFSSNCISGLVEEGKCNCWRCRKARKEPVSDETNAQAAREAVEARAKFAQQQEALKNAVPSGVRKRRRKSKGS